MRVSGWVRETSLSDLLTQVVLTLVGGTKMKYMLLVYMNEQAMTDEERAHCYVESAQLTQTLNASGQYVAAGPPPSLATAPRGRGRAGKPNGTPRTVAGKREKKGGRSVARAEELGES